MKRTLTLAAVGAVALSMSACGGSDSSDAAKSDAKDDSVKAVATTTQICDYVTQLADGGDDLTFVKTDSQGKETTTGSGKTKLELTCLLAPNASAHEHEMTPQQMKALGDADLFLVSGVDLEHFLANAVDSSGFKGTMVVSSGTLTSGEKPKDTKFKIDEGVEKVKLNDWPFPPENPGDAPEFVKDPHIWTDPSRAAIQVKNIGHALGEAAPSEKEVFKKHAESYEKKLKALDKWAEDSFNTVDPEHRTLFTSHDAFGYLSERYGIKFIGSALSDFSGQQDATAEHINKAVEQVKESGANALFAENSNNSKSIEAIARAAGVKAVIGDDALYGDSLGPEGTDGETYIKATIHNITNLVEAWGGTVQPLPEELK
ncbi:metal ABC transporter substrate-binding protein [Corynebacterium spheniscorum]|uniref:Zinc/manganese transport system substrate-binding protein n=1 Tax=Corynebacterium spheniscorum TaxID=185761 RepID=A0A1I2PQF8_9CORY|nr:metal ABC transporter substrate-binding protein [Corynebacterium spheniscorum]KAA8723397.1 zinc ABC transporter substrate-binding protein [Corynebacterium spheniscorum]SFG18284.1 zinc/manganese transport system substrate-binding protein [Corynebacterium spheniscorum]